MYDVIIVGCGVTGAAAAYALSRYKLKIGIVERGNDVAVGTTKANSAIMHAGYDPKPGTDMARLNRRGIALAADICRRLDVEYRPLPSLVIAFNEREMEDVRDLYGRGIANGVRVKILDHDAVLAAEPSLNPAVIGALYCDESAIINPWEFATAMAEVAVQNGADLMLETAVSGIEKHGDYLSVQTERGNIDAKFVINAAGCHSADVCRMVGDDRLTQTNYTGQYFVLDKSEGERVHHVIFRCPDELGFKGVLVAPTVHGNLIVGPDAAAGADGDDVSTTAERLAEVRRQGLDSIPSINFRNVIRQYAGVRPTTGSHDFVIDVSPACDRLINLAGICSPGLSAAPAVGEEAVRLLAGQGLALEINDNFDDSRPPVVRFAEMTDEERAALIEKNPAYGRIICRCETVTEGEIIDAVHRPIPARTIDGVKRRCRAGMGRCQGGFCSPRVHEIISRESDLPEEGIVLDRRGSYIITGRTKA